VTELGPYYPVVLALDIVPVFALAGLGWFLQIVHYPLYRRVDRHRFLRYHAPDQMLSAAIITPLMLVDLAASFLMFGFPYGGDTVHYVTAGMICTLVAWSATIFFTRSYQKRLAHGFDPRAFRRLLVTHWIRTYAWSFHAVALLLVVMHSLR
jgi:hypothetical protein